MTNTQLFLVGVSLVLVAAAAVLVARSTSRPWREALRADTAPTLLLVTLLAAGVLRVVLVTPSFLHANLHVTGLLEGIFGFPREASHRATYGQYVYLLLGAITSVVGRRFEAVVACNQLFGVAALAALALLARRWAGDWWAAFVVVALGALHPALLRVAASEDAHNLALLLGAVALLGLDVYAVSRRASALVVGVAALVLMVHTRQTFYPWLPFAALCAVARSPSLLRAPLFWCGALVAAAALAQRLAALMGSSTESMSLQVLPVLFGSRSTILAMLRYHPLLDVTRFGPTLPLAFAVGLVQCLRAGAVTRVFVAAWFACFAVTLPFALPTPGVDLAFRLPVIAMALVIAGVGVGPLLSRVQASALVAQRRWMASAGLLVLLLVVALAPRLTPSWSHARWRATDYREYIALREAIVPSLPKRIRLIRPRVADPSWQPPIHLFTQAGIAVKAVVPGITSSSSDDGPRILVAGVQCWGHPLGEGKDLDMDSPESQQWFRSLFEQIFRRSIVEVRDVRAVGVLPVMRAPCVELLDGAVQIGGTYELAVEQDLPFVAYPVEPVPLRIYRLRDD